MSSNIETNPGTAEKTRLNPVESLSARLSVDKTQAVLEIVLSPVHIENMAGANTTEKIKSFSSYILDIAIKRFAQVTLTPNKILMSFDKNKLLRDPYSTDTFKEFHELLAENIDGLQENDTRDITINFASLTLLRDFRLSKETRALELTQRKKQYDTGIIYHLYLDKLFRARKSNYEGLEELMPELSEVVCNREIVTHSSLSGDGRLTIVFSRNALKNIPETAFYKPLADQLLKKFEEKMAAGL